MHNVDVFSDMNFVELIDQHRKSKALISLVIRNRESSRKLLFHKNYRLTGWKHIKKNEVKWVDYPVTDVVERAFSGVYVASPAYPEKINRKGSFSIIPQWLDMAKYYTIKGVEHNEGFWFDLGSAKKIGEAESNMSC